MIPISHSGPFLIRDVTGSVKRVTRRVPQMEQKLLILLEHMNSPPVLVEFVLLYRYLSV